MGKLHTVRPHRWVWWLAPLYIWRNVCCVAQCGGMFRRGAFTDERKAERCCACVMPGLRRRDVSVSKP